MRNRFSLAFSLVAVHLVLVGLAFLAEREALASRDVDSSFGVLVSTIVFGFVDYPLAGMFESLRPHLHTYGERLFAAIFVFGALGNAKWFTIGALLQALPRWLFSKGSQLNKSPLQIPGNVTPAADAPVAPPPPSGVGR
jgi:hypothetical protein